MSHQRDLPWSGSFPHSPVLPRRAESRHDIIGDTVDAFLCPPAGGALALVDDVYPALCVGPPAPRGLQQLLLLTRQRHLLLVSRQFVECQMWLQSLVDGGCGRRGALAPSELAAVCRRLREVSGLRVALLKRLRADPCLYPTLPPIQEASRDLPGRLLGMAVKATLLTEELALAALRRVARAPSEMTSDLVLSLALYNQVASDLSQAAAALTELRPFTISRTLAILAEERGAALAGEFCRGLSHSGLVDILRSHAHMSGHPISPPSAGGQRSSGGLDTLAEEDRTQVTPALRALAGLGDKMWRGVPGGPAPTLYEQYSVHLWSVIYSHVFHAFYPGRSGHRALPALPPFPQRACVSAIGFLQERLASETLPEPGATLGRRLCQRLLCTQGAIAWDWAVCRALSSALTDKCAASPLDNDGPAPETHSRTAGILLSVCEPLSCALGALSSAPPAACDLHDSASWQWGLLGRCALSLQLCASWLRGHTHCSASSGALTSLVLVTHGDLPVLRAEWRSLVAAVQNAEWLPLTHPLCMRVQSCRDVLEGQLLSLPTVLGSVCTRRAVELLQHMMPPRRRWRVKMGAGVEPGVSEYAEVLLGAVVRPVLDGVRRLGEEEQVAAVSAALTVVMETWMSHILREKVTFSLQGALQLRRDFESVRDALRSREAGLSPEVAEAALSLPVFLQADNAIVCLLQQPSRKAYLQPGSCALFLCCPPMCRVAVESVSDSLQSLESLERRTWQRGISGRLPRHTHDSYLPHHQRQWLSLRLHKRWSGLSLPWETRAPSD